MLSFTGEPDRFVLGDAPFWPVDHLAQPDAWAGHIPFAFWIIAALRPRLLVELGTHSGNSYLAFAQAVHRLGLGTACFAVDTWRGDAHAGHYGEEVFQKLSRHHDARYGAFSRLVRSTFDDAVQHFADGSVDLLHVDGFHTYEAVAHDLETWRRKLSARAVVLFHDINVREGDFGVWRLWGELQSGHPHFTFLHAHGLGVLGLGSDLPAAVTVLLQATQDAAESSRIREAFARLGSSVVERMHFQASGEVRRTEIAALEEAARGRDQAWQTEIARLGEELTARDARAGEERAAIEEAWQSRDQAWQTEIARLGEELTARDARAGEERAAIEEAWQSRDQAWQTEIARLGEELTARDALIRRAGEERAAIEEAWQSRDQAWQTEIARLGEELTARDALIRRAGEERAALEEAARSRDQASLAEIEEQRRLIGELQHEIVRLGTLRETDRQELVAVREQLNRVERECSQASGEAEALRAALTELHQSTSLRITEPLRRGADWCRTVVAWARRCARSP